MLNRFAEMAILSCLTMAVTGWVAFELLGGWESGSQADLSICALQGDGAFSPYAGQPVRVQGVVTADLDETAKKGFFIQEPDCDGDAATSDGIFVFTSTRTNLVSLGDRVEVSGVVQEYYGMTEINAQAEQVNHLSGGNPLPAAVDLNSPFDNLAALAYLESLEGMLVSMAEALVCGPTNNLDETWVIRTGLDVDRPWQGEPRGTGQTVCIDDGGLFELSPKAGVGDRVQGLAGVLEYTHGLYRVQLLGQPAVFPVTRTFKPFVTNPGFAVATFNLQNLFDTIDEPDKDDPVLAGSEYQRRLAKLALAIHSALGEPALIAVQEAENQTVLQQLALRPEIEADYGIVWIDGPDRRGIDIALLYRQEMAKVLAVEQRQGCTALVDGLGPDGNDDVWNPANALTCDRNGDGVLDGNRLFSRPPLVVTVEVCSGLAEPAGSGRDCWEIVLIANHWKSKNEDTSTRQFTLPRRLEQAYFVADLLQEVEAAQPGRYLVVAGDMNDYPDSQPMAILARAGLRDLTQQVGTSERYTFIFQGVSQVLDYVLINNAMQLLLEAGVVHINTDYPAELAGIGGTLLRSSDHDPLLVRFWKAGEKVYLPVVGGR